MGQPHFHFLPCWKRKESVLNKLKGHNTVIYYPVVGSKALQVAELYFSYDENIFR
jgi:hypothetical protein